MPLYCVHEDIFSDVIQSLELMDVKMICVEPLHVQNDQITMYRGWDVTRQDGMKVIMWDTHRINRDSTDKTVELTIGTPNGRKGLELLRLVENTLVKLGATKLA